MLRFWTDGDPHDAASMKALAELSDDFRGRGVTFVGAFYSTGSAIERDWQAGREAGGAVGRELPESPTTGSGTPWTIGGFGISNTCLARRRSCWGLRGRVIHVHPGPAYYPTDDPLAKMCNDDFLALRAAIRNALTDTLGGSASRERE